MQHISESASRMQRNVAAGQILQSMLEEFHTKFGAYRQPVPGASWPPEAVLCLREALIREEVGETLAGLKELLQASQNGDSKAAHRAMIEVYDGILDSVYVLIGTAVACGLDFGNGFAEVHRSNMSKTPVPVCNPGDKYAAGVNPKGPGYTPPDLEQFMQK